ncbi:MAG: aminotransferase class V-fold PLP-dependent enzyme, partial [Tissierellia bacterium]|nr:aminotransferase class V-fold PLP-dependent enzyme [Tissierellia bacterium]
PTTGVFSTRSRQAMVDFIENRYENGMDILDFEGNWRYADRVRALAAEVINSESDEIFFSGSGSEMLNVISNGIIVQPSSNVVTTDLSFPSTPYTWMNRLGVHNVRIGKSVNGQIDTEDLLALVDNDTVAISICLVENTSGYRHDVEDIGKFCRENNILFILDATQCIGAMEIDVKKMHIDFLIATTYKWLSGPFGISFAYVSNRIVNDIKPVYVGWTGNKDRHNHSRYLLDLEDGAKRFELGSLNWIGLKGIEQSMLLYLELGKSNVEEYILSLTDYFYEQISQLESVRLIGPFRNGNRSGISYIEFPEEWKLTDRILRENGIRAHVAGKNTIRIGLHFYNNNEDIDVFINFIKQRGK